MEQIAVCDDDKATREHIISLIKEQIQDAELVTFASGEEMLKAQEQKKYNDFIRQYMIYAKDGGIVNV